MKKNIILSLAALIALASCAQRQEISKAGIPGTLSFAGCNLSVDEDVETKSVMPAGGNYTVIINDQSGENEPVVTNYKAIKDNDNKISLPEGKYTVIARSEEDVPAATFEQPVYGAQKEVTIVSGETTEIGEMICKLLQVKVTVDYSEEFLAMVTGNCTTTVSVSPTDPLVYNVSYTGGAANYDHSAGYFAVNNGSNTTMEIVFKGSVNGSNGTQNITISNIKPCTWHQIKFVKKASEDGSADFSIVIEDLVEDIELNSNVLAAETVIGDDPDAPKGDGGIKLESTCSYDITQPIIVPGNDDGPFVLTMKAIVPNGVLKFSVDITSDNPNFVGSVKMINNDSATLDLVNPSAGAIEVFTTILPFPYGEAVAGKTEIDFNLSDAQTPINGFTGSHSFVMNVMDKTGCKKSIPITMVVPE